MTIDEAIKILRDECCVPNSEFQKPKYQARALGIEALKVVERDRNLGMPWAIQLLPGETKD